MNAMNHSVVKIMEYQQMLLGNRENREKKNREKKGKRIVDMFIFLVTK